VRSSAAALQASKYNSRVDANFGFLAKQLLLTELHGKAVDINGGIAVLTDSGIWHGLWEASHLGNLEAYVTDAQKKATDAESTFRGVVSLSQHGEAGKWDELAEALFVYGLPEASGPESVMVLANPPHPKPRGLRFLTLAESPGFSAMACGAVETSGELTGPAWPDAQVTCELLDIHVAWHNSTPVGAVGLHSTDLALRIAMLWIEPAWREKEVAQALVEHVAQQAQAGGKLLVTAWAKKAGLLRFALHEAGMEEQVTARFFAS
jgi:hypothetical protein